MSKVSPCLWFDGEAEEAAKLYVSLVPDSRIERIQKNIVDGPAGKAGGVLVVQFTLGGQEFMALNGGVGRAMRMAQGSLWRVLADRAVGVAEIARRLRSRRRRAGNEGDVADGQARYCRTTASLRGQVGRLGRSFRAQADCSQRQRPLCLRHSNPVFKTMRQKCSTLGIRLQRNRWW
jgi:predicted 3-demethylubiquinone-9 3-methyltransferase (glyoxalase superfamily)